MPSHLGRLQNDPIVNVADVLGGRGCVGSLASQQVEDARGQRQVVTVLDELAEVGEAALLRLRVVLDDGDDGGDDGVLVVVAAVLAQHRRQERHHHRVFARELEAQRADRFHHHDLELVRDLGHEAGYLFHEAVDAALVARLE